MYSFLSREFDYSPKAFMLVALLFGTFVAAVLLGALLVLYPPARAAAAVMVLCALLLRRPITTLDWELATAAVSRYWLAVPFVMAVPMLLLALGWGLPVGVGDVVPLIKSNMAALGIALELFFTDGLLSSSMLHLAVVLAPFCFIAGQCKGLAMRAVWKSLTRSRLERYRVRSFVARSMAIFITGCFMAVVVLAVNSPWAN